MLAMVFHASGALVGYVGPRLQLPPWLLALCRNHDGVDVLHRLHLTLVSSSGSLISILNSLWYHGLRAVVILSSAFFGEPCLMPQLIGLIDLSMRLISVWFSTICHASLVQAWFWFTNEWRNPSNLVLKIINNCVFRHLYFQTYGDAVIIVW